MNREAPTRTWQAAFAVALPLAILYLITAQRGVCWQDSGVRQLRALTGDLVGIEGGIALAHPLYVAVVHLIARVFPASGVLWALNFFSGLGMAVAAGACAWLARRMTSNMIVACGAGLWLGVAHMPWWLATVTEVYTWSLALFTLELVALYRLFERRRSSDLILVALFSGLGVAVHNFALLALPVWGAAACWLVWRRDLRARALVAAAAVWLVAASPLLILVIRATCGPLGVVGAVRDALFGESYRGVVLGVIPAVPLALVLANLALFLLSLASPFWLAAGSGLRQAWRTAPRPWTVALTLLTVIHVLFFARYFVADQATFCLPTLSLLALWSAAGWAGIAARRGWSARRLTIMMLIGVISPILFYQAVFVVMCAHAWQPTRARRLPFRDEARYWTIPWKQNEDSAERFARAVFEQCGAGDLVYADSTAAGPLLASRWLHAGTDTLPRVVSCYDRWTHDRAAWRATLAGPECPNLYVVSAVPGYLPIGLDVKDAHFTPTGVLVRIEWPFRIEWPYGGP